MKFLLLFFACCVTAAELRVYPERLTNNTFKVWWQPVAGATNTAQWSTNGLTWEPVSNWHLVQTGGVRWCYTQTCLKCEGQIFYRVRIDPIVP